MKTLTNKDVLEIASGLANYSTESMQSMCREDRVNAIAQMLADLYMLATKDGCVAAAWALEFLGGVKE